MPPLAKLLSEANPVGLAVGAAQTVIGAAQAIGGNRRLNRLMKQRTTFQTPQEAIDSYNMAQNEAQTGFGANTMAYMTNQSNRSLTSTLSSLTALGGDANQVAGIFDSNFQNIFKIAAENEEVQMKKFAKLYESLDVLRQNKEAEWASKEALLKDKMAMEADKVRAGQANMQSGLNMGLSAISQGQEAQLFSKNNGMDYIDGKWVKRKD